MNRASIARAGCAPGAARLLALGAAALVLGGCGDVEIATGMEFPKPLVEQLPMTVGVYYSDEFRKYAHDESRWGVDWKVELGQYHVGMGDRLFESAFRDTVPVKSPTDVPPGQPLRAVIEPRIEQYSFITPRDTGAKYYAVTIRYRLNVFAPDGRLADSLTFTGYGSAPSAGLTSTSPMVLATKSAMRDAAAKFLVQFPEQPIAKKMIAELPLIEASAPAVAAGTQAPPAAGSDAGIESMPIVDDAHPSGSTPVKLPGTPLPSRLPSGRAPAPPSKQPPAAQPPAGAGTTTPAPSTQPPADPRASGTPPTDSVPAPAPQTSDTPGEPSPQTPKEYAPDKPKSPDPEPALAEGPSRWTVSGR